MDSEATTVFRPEVKPHRVRVVEHFAAFLRETGRVAEADELEAREAELRAAVSSDAS